MIYYNIKKNKVHAYSLNWIVTINKLNNIHKAVLKLKGDSPKKI